ncbi:MAG: hypothetical protein IT493_02165 [Gammaproteobacteria bacterium]|nr:hypothetical protein [Gammaproteobacteria bacterium]
MIEEALRVDADGLALEARLAYADDLATPRSAVLICPPHPFLGGDMDNNVLCALSAALVAAGLPVLRFNYRGIGASETDRPLDDDQREFWQHSTCPRYEAEIMRDCASAFDALRGLLPAAALAVVGYSFGCLPALAIAGRAPLARLALISPPLVKWAVATASYDLPLPRALFYAPGDFACPRAQVEALHGAASGARELHVFPDADHFFIGHEAALAAAVTTFLVSR